MTHQTGIRLRSAVLATVGVLLVATGCSGGDADDTPAPATTSAGSGTSAPAASTAATPEGKAAALKFGLPKYPEALVDAEGRTVYTFSGDRHGNVTCLDACAQEWPPVLTVGDPTFADDPTAAGGTQGLGNGLWQATYSSWPLYYYSGDTAPGQANGLGKESFGGRFTIILRNGNRIG
ncbi:hypothetical protein ABNF97_20000 [Plantactinospora sp. B6F1]|uniref:hypothetical protein n=1 Tax=Plantactinospora sp. B6F1 TaxID=3158971 RepID=UPI00102B00C9